MEYPTNLTDKLWQFIEKILDDKGSKRKHLLCRIIWWLTPKALQWYRRFFISKENRSFFISTRHIYEQALQILLQKKRQVRCVCQDLIKAHERLPYPVEKTLRKGYFSGTEERGVPHRGTMSWTPRNDALLGAPKTTAPQPWTFCKKKSQYTCQCRRTPTILKGWKTGTTSRTLIHKKNDGHVWSYNLFWLLSSKNQARCPNKPSMMLRQRILPWTDR